jgi:glycine/D-amino acid oxidase-like deaminating enzyme/nitrite reductase/ring-hydroxylating ferredoxin subunit
MALADFACAELAGARRMNVLDEQTRSLWMDEKPFDAPQLSNSVTADVAVVGAGIAGLSCAYELAKLGRSVVVVDRGAIGGGMTLRTTAHLASACDDFYTEVENRRGEKQARLLYQSLAASIDRMEEIQRSEKIDCDFQRVDGFWVLAPGCPESRLDEELDACKRLGIPAENCTERTAIHEAAISRSLRFPRQARVNPAKYIRGLAAAVRKHGGQLFANTSVTQVTPDSSKVRFKTHEGYEIVADHAVVATNSPVHLKLALHSKQAPYRTYAIAALLPKGALKDALYWDTLDPYHYVRLQPLSDKEEIVIVGGEDHKCGEADDGEARFAALESWTRTHLPNLGAVTHRWSGQVLEPVDFVGFVGRSPDSKRIFLATGDSGQGITNGAVAGILIRDLIATGSSPSTELYDPGRKIPTSLGDYVSENLTTVANFAEYLTASGVSSAEQLKPGEGRIFRSGMSKLAACRDEQGNLHVRSASCTHMGCIVHWNSTEQCWDCPCHGSQFAPDGTALNGPAASALSPAGT